jgi:outer membrane protein assembly factor BamD (BamD/ComL family)
MKTKNQFKYALLFLPFSMLLVNCTETREDKLKKISVLEEKFYSADHILPNDTTSSTLVRMYASFAQTFPGDSLSPTYLFKAGEITNGIRRFDESLSYFKRICDTYPDHKKTPFSWFFRGFIFENMLSDSAGARMCYTTFLQKYPSHPLAHDVSFAVKNLGRNSLDVVHEFEKANQDSLKKAENY